MMRAATRMNEELYAAAGRDEGRRLPFNSQPQHAEAQSHLTEALSRTAASAAVMAITTILRIDPTALLYVATVLAQRLDSANKALLELKRQVRDGEPGSVIGRTVEKIEGLLGATGANLMYAGYPYDPFASDAPRS